MSRLIQTIVKLVVAVFAGLILDGVILRDPWVELGNGYNIGATSWSEPCHLLYWEFQDPRPPAAWSARRAGDSLEIFNRETGEYREYGSERAWKGAIQNLKARPSSGQILLDRVAGFDRDKRFAIGRGEDGCFLLDMVEDELTVWTAPDTWAEVVQAKTRLDPDELRDPTSWHLQYRHAVYWIIMGPYLALVALLTIAPLIRSRSGTRQ